MSKLVGILGLGIFGSTIAKTLSEFDSDVTTSTLSVSANTAVSTCTYRSRAIILWIKTSFLWVSLNRMFLNVTTI